MTLEFQSLPALKAQLQAHPDRPDSYLHLAIAFWDAQNYPAALNTLQQLLQLPNPDPLRLEGWINRLAQADRVADAQTLCDAWLAQWPLSPWPHFYRGILAARAGQWAVAIEHHIAAVQRDPRPEFARRCHVMVRILLDRGQHNRAIDYCQTILTIAPQTAILHQLLGTSYEGIKNFNHAKHAYIQAICCDAHIVSAEQVEDKAFMLLGTQTFTREHHQGVQELTDRFFTQVLAQRSELAYLGIEWADRLGKQGRAAEAESVRQSGLRQLQREIDRDRHFVEHYHAWAQRCQTDNAPLVQARLQLMAELTRSEQSGSQDLAAVSATLCHLRSQQQKNSHTPTTSGSSAFEPTLPRRTALRPKGAFHRTEIYCQTANLPYVSLHPATTFTLQPATTIGQPHSRFGIRRTGDATETFVTMIPQGRACWGGNTRIPSLGIGAAITPDNHLLADLSPRFPIPTFFLPYPDVLTHWSFTCPIPEPTHLPGRVAVLATITGDSEVGNYFHWLTDLLPRVELLKRAGVDLRRIDTFLVDSYGGQFQRDSLEALGIPSDRVVDVRQFWHIQADELVLPSLAGKLTNVSQWVCNWLRDCYTELFAAKVSIAPTKRLYISRGTTHYRTILNEDRLIEVLSQCGFVCVEPQKLSFAEQVQLFSQAEAVVALHGAGLTNGIFCPPGAKVIELFAPGYVMHYYWTLCDRAGHDYFYLVGEGVQSRPLQRVLYPNEMTEDVTIDPDKLMQVLALAGLAP